MRYCLLLPFIFSFLQLSIAQVDSLSTDEAIVELDSAQAKKEDIGLLYMFKGKPGRAALYSLVIPSGGQFYNRKYWKVPIVLAAEAGAIWAGIYFNAEFQDAQDYYIHLLQGGTPDPDRAQNTTSARSLRDDARQTSEYVWFGFGVFHFITVIDAFVDRHLMDFDISEDLSIRPYYEQNQVMSSSFSGFTLAYQIRY